MEYGYEYKQHLDELNRLLKSAQETFEIMSKMISPLVNGGLIPPDCQLRLQWYGNYHQAIHREIEARQRQLHIMANFI